MFLFLFAPYAVHADSSCKSIDMTGDPGYVDTTDALQGNVGWCSHYSVAHLVSQKLKQPVSAKDLAFRADYFSQVLKLPNGKAISGNSMQGQKLFLEKEPWVCPIQNYKHVPSRFHEEALKEEVKIFEKGPCQFGTSKSSFFANITQLAEIQEAVRNSRDAVTYVKDLNEKNCKNKVAFNSQFDVREHVSGWDQPERHEQSARYLRSQMNKGKMVSFNFDPTFFFEHEISLKEKWRKQMDGGHRATLVGMTERNGECFYRVRDSTYAEPDNCKEAGNARVKCLDKFTYEVGEADLMKALKSTMVIAD